MDGKRKLSSFAEPGLWRWGEERPGEELPSLTANAADSGRQAPYEKLWSPFKPGSCPGSGRVAYRSAARRFCTRSAITTLPFRS